jgi:hypothetical protein
VTGPQARLTGVAQHLTVEDGNRRLMIAACDTKDKFMKVNGTGLFAERQLYVDWLEELSLSADPTVVRPSDEFLAPAIRARSRRWSSNEAFSIKASENPGVE